MTNQFEPLSETRVTEPGKKEIGGAFLVSKRQDVLEKRPRLPKIRLTKLTKEVEPMCKASVYEAKTQFSKYISLLESGKESEIIILKNGKKVAKLVPCEEEEEAIRLGAGLLFMEAKPFVVKSDEYDDYGELFGY